MTGADPRGSQRGDELDPRYAAEFQRGYDPTRHRSPAAAEFAATPDPAGEPSAGEPAPEPAAAEPPGPDARVPTRSGWRLALPVGVVSLAFLVASAVLVLLPAPAEASFVLSFPALLRATLQPALALGGGVGLAVAIVVAALRIPDDSADAEHDQGAPIPETRG